MATIPARTRARDTGLERTAREYNYEHFPPGMLYTDMAHSFRDAVRAGEMAPNFELTSTDGRRVRLGDLRGAPVVLHFGSPT